MRKPVTLLISLALLVSAISFAAGAFATIPDGDGVIHGCFRRSDGRLRVINTDRGQTCIEGERSLHWSKRGRQGPRGEQGLRGRRGLQGLQGEQGIQGLQGDPGVTSPSVQFLTATSVLNGVNTTHSMSWTQPPGTVATEIWLRFTIATPPGPCDGFTDTGGVSVNYKLNGVTVSGGWGTSSPGTLVWPTLESDAILGGVLFPGEYELVAHINNSQLVAACFGTEVTTEAVVETVAGTV
jgi:hypothetical protein